MRFTTYAPTRGVRHIGSALTPVMNRTYAGWSSRGRIFGQPGTMGINAPDPAATPGHERTAMASGGVFSTKDAPNLIFPALYYENDAPLHKEHAPVSRISDDQMPVPAQRGRNVYTADAYKPRLGGQRQVYQPQVQQRWLGLKGTPYG